MCLKEIPTDFSFINLSLTKNCGCGEAGTYDLLVNTLHTNEQKTKFRHEAREGEKAAQYSG